MHETKWINNKLPAGYSAFSTSCLEHTEIVAGPRDKLDIFCFSKINDFPQTETPNNGLPDGDWEEPARLPSVPPFTFYFFIIFFTWLWTPPTLLLPTCPKRVAMQDGHDYLLTMCEWCQTCCFLLPVFCINHQRKFISAAWLSHITTWQYVR